MNTSKMYRKRAGTSGIRGQLYETKLLSLFLFRAQHNDLIEDFYLGTNVEGNGAFDDICLHITLKGHSRPIAIFIQAKHTENEDKVLTLNNKNDLAKYFESFMKIKLKFNIKSPDPFFKRNYDDTDCVFVLYTTKQGDFNNIFNGSCADILNDLIATGDLGSQPLYTKEDLEFLCKIALKEEIKRLATRLLAYIYNKKNDMNDELILRYHVLLAEKVIKVSNVQPDGRRIAKFRVEFYSAKDDELLLLKETLFEGILSKHVKAKPEDIVLDEEEEPTDELLPSFLLEPTEYKFSHLLFRNVIRHKNGQLKFIDTMPINLIEKLERINMPLSYINLGIIIAVKRILRHFRFDVPATFGNKDLAVKGNFRNIDKRLKYLTNQMYALLAKPTSDNIITINETNDYAKFFRINGGLDSAVGNLLVLDQTTKLLKFNDNLIQLEKHSKAFLKQLESKISNLYVLRLDVRLQNFPRLSFEFSNEDLANEFFNKLVFFTNQEDEEGVGKILKQEIECHEGVDTKYFQIKSNAIFQQFHVNIQNWWMVKMEANYLNKTCDFYQKAKDSLMNNSMITVLSIMYLRQIRNLQCTFNEKPTMSLKSVDLQSRNIIVTDIIRLTFIKLTRALDDNDYVVLDLKFIQNFPINDLSVIARQLHNINKEKYVIIVCDNILHRNLLIIARAVQNRNFTVITNKTYIGTIIKHFSNAKITNDEGNSLFDLSQQSQKKIIEKARVIFQGQEINLDLIIDDISVALIKGVVLNKILSDEKIVISDTLELSTSAIELMNYNATGLKYEIKDLFIERKVTRGQLEQTESKIEILQTLHDIKDDVVLITAKPGMGKSTLLSFLSIKTKQLDEQIWVIRMNLLDYSKEFNIWKKNQTFINTFETLTFICQVIVKNKLRKGDVVSLTDNNGDVHVKNSIDNEWITFELELFLHYFKSKNIIFLFDGFDEICPTYEDEVVSFVNAIRTYHQKHRIWITSRPYNKIKSMLQQNFEIAEPYELIPLADNEQIIYFEKFWKYNLVLSELNDAQLQNIIDFLLFIKNNQHKVFVKNFIRINKPQSFILNKVYLYFMVYLEREVQFLPMDFPLQNKYRELLHSSTRLSKYSLEQFRTNLGVNDIKELLEFVGTPLHMYLVANYFLSAIKDDNDCTKEWDLDINTYAIYENFLESKLKKIRLEDKNKMDMYKPDMIEAYTTIREAFINIHKKLAAYAIFQINGQVIFNTQDMKEIHDMIEKIEIGGEKTGLIYSVNNNIPQFIHMTFMEYFAVEYISDILKKEKDIKKQEEICYFIVNTMFLESSINVLNILDLKVKIDTEFACAIEKNKTFIFKVLMSQSAINEDYKIINQNQVKSSVNEAIKKNLNNFLSIFMTTIEDNVNENNLDDYIKYVINTGFLRIAIIKSYDDLILKVFNVIRNIDISKWRKFVSNPRYYCYDVLAVFRIQRLLRHHFLCFYNWSHLCVQGLFVMNSEAA